MLVICYDHMCARQVPVLRVFVLQALIVVRDWIEQTVPRALKGVQCAVIQVNRTIHLAHELECLGEL